MNRDRRRTRLLLIVLLLTSFTLITLDYRAGSGNPFGFLRDGASAVFGPLERAASAVARPVGDAVSDIGSIGRDRDRIDDLERENKELIEQLRLNELDDARAEQVQELLDLAGRARFRIMPARVIAIGGGLGFEWTATIDAGADHGLRRDMTVINGDGLVGRVQEVGRTTSTILLANDRQFTAFSRLASSLETGYVSGEGRDGLSLSLLSQTALLERGERLVTIGRSEGSLFTPEVPIGVVERVRRTPGALTRTAVVRPYVNFSSLDIIGVVVRAPEDIERNALLPPSPTPSPSPDQSPDDEVSPSPSGSARPTRSP